MAGGFPNVTFGYVGTPAVDLLMASKIQNDKVLNTDITAMSLQWRSENMFHTTASQFKIPETPLCNLEVLGL